MNSIDPVTLEVIRNALTAAAEGMSLTVMRCARSPLLREAGDLSSALTDANGELIAQGRDIPMHLGVMAFTVKEFLKRVARERLRPGDVWFLNLPDVGGNHLPDVKAIQPIFHAGALQAFAVSLAHWADIGGAVPGSYVANASDAWQEGLRIAPLRLFGRDGPDREKLDFVLANVRGDREREGDILAQMAATRMADERLQEILTEHGVETVQAAIRAMHDNSAEVMRDVIRQLPRGPFVGEDFLDDDGTGSKPIAVRVRMTFAEGVGTFDFSATDDAARGPVNTTPFITAAGVLYAMNCLARDDDASRTGGALRPLRVITRPGSLLQPGPDRPVVGGNHETSQRVVDAIFRGLEPVIPERLSAGGPTTSGLLLFSFKDAGGSRVTLYETHGGGEGARTDRDGMPVVRVHMSNVMNTPAEIIEAAYPLRVVRQELRRGSGGGGRHRGGDGLRRDYLVMAEEGTLTTMFERRVVPPYGLQGGASGAPFRCTLTRADGSSRELPGKCNIALRAGDRVLMESSGGGGYGAAP